MAWPCTGTCPDGSDPFTKSAGELGLNLSSVPSGVSTEDIWCTSDGAFAMPRACESYVGNADQGSAVGVNVFLGTGQSYTIATPTFITVPAHDGSCCVNQFVHLLWEPTSQINTNGSDQWCVTPAGNKDDGTDCAVPENTDYPPKEPMPGARVDYQYQVTDATGSNVIQGWTPLLSEERKVIGDHAINIHQTLHVMSLRPCSSPAVRVYFRQIFTGISEGITAVTIINETGLVRLWVLESPMSTEIFPPDKPGGDKVRGLYSAGTVADGRFV